MSIKDDLIEQLGTYATWKQCQWCKGAGCMCCAFVGGHPILRYFVRPFDAQQPAASDAAQRAEQEE